MKKFIACVLLSVFSTVGFAEVPIDSFYQPGLPDSYPIFIIERGNLQDANGILFNPVCAGQLQSPALIIDLNAFFFFFPGTRIVDRGHGHYLIMQTPETATEENLQTTAGTSHTVYVELDFNSSTDGAFILRAASPFLADTGVGANCLAGDIHEWKRVKSS